jgi:hypothetical protein
LFILRFIITDFNYSLGVALLFFALGYFIRAEEKLKSNRHFFLFPFLCTLLFFAQLVPFIILLGLAFVRWLFFHFNNGFSKSGKQFVLLFTGALPGVILAGVFYFNRTEISGPPVEADTGKSFRDWWRMQPIVTLSDQQIFYVQALALLLFAAALVQLVYFIIRFRATTSIARMNFFYTLICFVLVTAMIFLVPDSFGGGGVMTTRLIELSWLFMALFLAMANFPRLVNYGLVACCLVITVINFSFHSETVRYLNGFSSQAQRMGKYMEPNSTGAYIPMAGHWLLAHAGELAFAESRSVLMSDYETLHDYFPLKFKHPLPASYDFDSLNPHEIPCASCWWPAEPERKTKPVDYILLCRQYVSDSACYNRLNLTLTNNYRLIQEDPPFYLYESNAHATGKKE